MDIKIKSIVWFGWNEASDTYTGVHPIGAVTIHHHQGFAGVAGHFSANVATSPEIIARDLVEMKKFCQARIDYIVRYSIVGALED